MRQIILDIETAPLHDAAQYLEPVSAPANYKDPAKIDAYVLEQQARHLERAALDLDLCQILAIGIGGLHDRPHFWLNRDGESERGMLNTLWSLFPEVHFVGFNLLAFDLPVLLRRSLYLGIQAPTLVLDRYRTPHVDLLQRLTWNGLVHARSLEFYCRRLGIIVEDAVDGAQIPALAAAGHWDQIETHCLADVERTRRLADRMRLLHAYPSTP